MIVWEMIACMSVEAEVVASDRVRWVPEARHW